IVSRVKLPNSTPGKPRDWLLPISPHRRGLQQFILLRDRSWSLQAAAQNQRKRFDGNLEWQERFADQLVPPCQRRLGPRFEVAVARNKNYGRLPVKASAADF